MRLKEHSPGLTTLCIASISGVENNTVEDKTARMTYRSIVNTYSGHLIINSKLRRALYGLLS